jgi:hypothetical protein
MQEILADVGNVCVFPYKPVNGSSAIAGTTLGARDGLRTPLYPAESASERPRGVESGNLEAIGGGGYGEGGNAAIDPDKTLTAAYRGRVVAALWMEVGCFHIEADQPAITVPSNRCEQESSARYQSWGPCQWPTVLDRTKESS